MTAPSYDQPNTWQEMQRLVLERMRNEADERIGQAWFNALALAWPEVAELVRGTNADPFYADKGTDPRMERFFEVITPYFV